MAGSQETEQMYSTLYNRTTKGGCSCRHAKQGGRGFTWRLSKVPKLKPGTGTNSRLKMVVKRAMSYCPTSDMNCLCSMQSECLSAIGRQKKRKGGGTR